MTPNYDDPQVFYDDPQVRYDVTTPAPKKMSDNINTYPVNEVLGFMAGTQQMLTDKKTAMIAKGVDPTAIITGLEPTQQDLTVENSTQEGMKTQLRTQTELVDGIKTNGYNLASQGCDQLISAFGRNSQEAKEAIALRKSVRPARRRNTSQPPTP